jgi:hypothetical protein
MTPDMKDGSSTARWRSSWQIATWRSFCLGVRSLGTNFAATQCMFKSHVRIVFTVLCDTLTIVAVSLMVLWRSSCTSRWIVSTFLGVQLMEGRPDLSSSSSDVLLLLKRACHSKHLARLMASFLYARRIISKVSAPDLLSFTQNLMFALCSSFTSMLKLQMWRDTWWQTLVLCNSQCSHSDTTQHAEWWHSLLPSTAHSFTYCHRLVVYGTSLKTFWYTPVFMWNCYKRGWLQRKLIIIFKVAFHKGAVSQSTMFECYKLFKNGLESLTDNQCSSCLYTTLAKVSFMWDQHAKILNKWQKLA